MSVTLRMSAIRTLEPQRDIGHLTRTECTNYLSDMANVSVAPEKVNIMCAKALRLFRERTRKKGQKNILVSKMSGKSLIV